MKFKYTGEAPEGQIVQCGVIFTHGGIAEVTNPADIEMLLNNRFFEAVENPPYVETVPDDAAKKRGRSKKDVTHDDPDDSTAL